MKTRNWCFLCLIEAIDDSSQVDAKGEADVLGILPGDLVRAVSYVGSGPEPGWLDKMLGAEAMPMKKAGFGHR